MNDSTRPRHSAQALGEPKGYSGEAVPRRISLDQMTPAEKAIYAAVQIVEGMGADVRLTHAVVHLSEARECVANFVDGVDEPKKRTVGCANTPYGGAAEGQSLTALMEEAATNHTRQFREVVTAILETSRAQDERQHRAGSTSPSAPLGSHIEAVASAIYEREYDLKFLDASMVERALFRQVAVAAIDAYHQQDARERHIAIEKP